MPYWVGMHMKNVGLHMITNEVNIDNNVFYLGMKC